MKASLAAMVLGLSIVATSGAWAEDKFAGETDMQALRASVRADKKALVASALQLTDAEAKRFWPLYDTYQRALNAANRQRAVVIEDLLTLNKPLSDLYAKTLATELIAADENE